MWFLHLDEIRKGGHPYFHAAVLSVFCCFLNIKFGYDIFLKNSV